MRRRRLKELAGCLVVAVAMLPLLPCALASAPTQRVSVTIPDSGAYYWWCTSPSGSVVQEPTQLAGRTSFRLPRTIVPGGTLFVLDKHTGGIASTQLPAPAAAGKPAPTIALTIADFHQISAANPAPGPAAAGPTPVSIAPVELPAQSAPSSPSAIIGTVFNWLLGLAVLAVVVVFLKKLFDTRGELFIQAARRVGIDVPSPNEMVDASRQEEREVRYTPPPAPKVQSVPEEAYAPLESAYQEDLRGPRLVGLDGLVGTTSYPLCSGQTSIGRDESNDITLNDSSVSRRHATITQRLGENAVLSDQDSANGVYLNGKKVETGVLSEGDVVQIGRLRFRFELR